MIKLPSLKRLIKKGYFPKELTPAFSSSDLSNSISRLNSVINKKEPVTRCSTISIPRLKNFRRVLSIPNPRNYVLISKSIIEGWKEIKNHLNKSTISISLPTVRDNADRYFSTKLDLGKLPNEKVLRSTSSRYLLYTDISRYYSTIYTHSIPWALHSKSVSKINKSNTLLGNQLDSFIRNGQYGQTLGIPVGPDTSLVISEIIGTSIDIELKKRIGKLVGLRYIDDYYLYFSTLSEAEFALSSLDNVLREFELELNNNKLSLIELPDSLESNWLTTLRSYATNDINKGFHLIDYFSNAFAYSKKHPNDFVLKYAVSKLKETRIIEDNWELYESLILNSIIADPSILPIATEIFLTYKNLGYPLNETKILQTLTEVIRYGLKFNHVFEISWALWIIKTLNIKINNSNLSKYIIENTNGVVALTFLDLLDQGLITHKVDLSNYRSLLTFNELYTENWLLGYESLIKGWLKGKNDYIKNEEFFNVLKTGNVSFYNSNLQVTELKLVQSIDNHESNDSLGSY